MTLNGLTIYDKNIIKYSTELKNNNGDSNYVKFIAAAIPSPNSQTNTANVLLEFDINPSKIKDGDNSDSSIIIGCDDTMDFIDDLMSCNNEGEDRDRDYEVYLATGFKVKYKFIMKKKDDKVSITVYDNINGNSIKYGIDIFASDVKNVCKCINNASDQALEILVSNRRLNDQMIQLRNDMKAEKVHELYFELYDEHPKVYKIIEENAENTSEGKNNLVKTYKITARDKESNPLYAFLRNMHLTCVPLVDYRDFGKEFLGCPFVYSDEMIELGKKFVEKKKKDVHSTVDEKINNKK